MMPRILVMMALVAALCCGSEQYTVAAVSPEIVPLYVTDGLEQYRLNGYEAAVKRWLADSPYQNAAILAANIAFFKNIELLAGRYQSYDILMTKQTPSSNVVYVRLNYERLPGYILFTSIKREGNWVLGKIQLDRTQRFGTGS